MKKRFLSILVVVVMALAMFSSATIMASALEEEYFVTYECDNDMGLVLNFEYTAMAGEDYDCSFSSSDEYRPANISITVGGVEIAPDLWSYDEECREIIIFGEAITGDICIYFDVVEINAIPFINFSSVSFEYDDKITAEASFSIKHMSTPESPMLYEVIDGVAQNGKAITAYDWDEDMQEFEVSYTFSKDDFSGSETKIFTFGLLVGGEWYYTNTFSVSYTAKLVVTDNDKYDIPVGIRGEVVSVDISDSVSGGVAPYTFHIESITGENNWLNLSTDGTLFGTRPMHVTGSFLINVMVTDAIEQTDTMWVLVEQTVVEEHTCADHLITVEEDIPTDCVTPGNIGYFICEKCETFYEDPLATSEISDKESVIIPAGHIYGEKVDAQEAIHTSDRLEPSVAAHYHCERCDKYFDEGKNPVDSYEELKGIAPTHTYNVVNGYKGEDGHADACSCGAYDTASVVGHSDSCVDDDCTTGNDCTICGYVITEARNNHEAVTEFTDCTVDRKCQYCSQIAIKGNENHTPKEKGNDCTADVMCNVEGCTKIAIEGCAEHTPEADDTDCTTDRMCTNEGCEQIAIKGNDGHTAVDPLDDCTLDRLCVNCEQVAVEGNAEHKPSEDDKDCTTATICTNDGCKVVLEEAKTSHTPETDDGNCTTDVKCINGGCDCVITAGLAAHVPSEDDGDCTTHVGCSNSGCNQIVIEAKENHTPATDDGDCTTAVKCSVEGCNQIAITAKENHTPAADDGDCTTAVKCSVEGCNKIAIEAKTAHADANNDGRCDACGTETGTNAPSTPSTPSEPGTPSTPSEPSTPSTPSEPSTPSDDNKETNAPATDAPSTDKVTDTENEDDTDTDDTDAPKKKGCGGAIALGGVAIIAIIGAGVTFAKRKED